MYDTHRAAKYWDKRIKNYDLQTAVLSLSFPKYLNDAYAYWEFNALKQEIEIVKNKTILDIGCGGGRNSIPLAKMGAKVTGIDISKQMLAFARIRAKKNYCLSNTNFICANAWKTGINSRFDKVLLLGILEHLPEIYRRKTIKEAKRLVKKNGKIFIMINNKKSIFLKLVKKWKKPKQKSSGYYSGLMDTEKIIKHIKNLNLKITNVIPNTNYSLLIHALKQIPSKNLSSSDENIIKSMFKYLVNLDLNGVLSKNQSTIKLLNQKFADQYFIVAKPL